MLKVILAGVICTAAALAQTTTSSNNTNSPSATVQAGPVPGIGAVPLPTIAIAGAAIAGPMSTVAGAPYSAQTSTERIQLLADGNRIQQTTSGSVARDSQGRVRREETLPGVGANDADAPHLIFIDDPVAGVHWNLNPETKTAFKMPFMQIKAPALNLSSAGAIADAPENTFVFTSAAGATGAGIQITSRTSLATSDTNVTKTDLGTQTIEGVHARGTRITRTIPAGTVGNDLPIVITTETWYSPDLKVLVTSKTSDPRMGDTTYTLTNIQQSEPPASLFQVPDGYTVKDQPGKLVFREGKKSE